MSITPTSVTFLGTSAVVPGCGHDTASFVINARYLVDTGWYAALRMQCYGIEPGQIEYLFLTHCHQDHYIGLPHLFFHLRMHPPAASRRPLTIVGPAGEVETVVKLARQFLQTDRFPELDYVPALVPLSPGRSFETDAFRLETCASIHPVPGLCYRFTDKQTGSAVAFTGDTTYNAPVADLARGAALLIHEASYGPKPAPPGDPWGHSGAPDAARIAAASGVGRLALIHSGEDRQDAAVEAARVLFPNTFWPADGEVVAVP
jgi:ribonuclease BN (tRNA processing enzyme)